MKVMEIEIVETELSSNQYESYLNGDKDDIEQDNSFHKVSVEQEEKEGNGNSLLDPQNSADNDKPTKTDTELHTHRSTTDEDADNAEAPITEKTNIGFKKGDSVPSRRTTAIATVLSRSYTSISYSPSLSSRSSSYQCGLSAKASRRHHDFLSKLSTCLRR